MKKRIFVICPVRNADGETNRKIEEYVLKQEDFGHEVYWPKRDTDQIDSIGLRICTDNARAIARADEIHIWYDAGIQGSLFDVGMTFMASQIVGPTKRIVLINPGSVRPTEGKSFANVLIALSRVDNAPS